MTIKRTDREICTHALNKARRVLSEYIDPDGARDASRGRTESIRRCAG
jgi:hypothetical protein